MLDSLLSQLSKKTDLAYNKKNNVLYGYYNNYCLSIQSFQNVAYVIFPLRLTESYNFIRINNFIQNLRDDFNEIESILYKDFYLSIKYNCSKGSIDLHKKNILLLVNSIIDEAKSNRLASCCPDCGKPTDIDSFIVNKGVLLRCNYCISKVKDRVASYPKYKHNNQPIIKAIMGSLLGSLIGVSLWIIFSLFGIYGGICGLAITLFAVKGFQIFGGELNKSGLLLSIIVSALMVLIASYISIGFVFYNKTSPDGIVDAIENISYWLSYDSIRKTFLEQLSIGYIFFGIGVIFQFVLPHNKSDKYNVSVQQLQ